MITETKAKQKAKKNYSKKSVLSPFSVKTKRIQIGPLISASPYHLQLCCCHTVQCFRICTRSHSTCGQETTFFIQNSLFINAWDSRILKEKRQKKNNKNKQTIPLFLQLFVLLIARMCPFKFF
jgi:hypothetical protein